MTSSRLRRKVLFRFLVVLGFAGAIWAASKVGESRRSSSTQPPIADSVPSEVVGEVVYVIDGDTVDIAINGQVERVRLIGIDTPETVSRTDPVQCFGAEASEALLGLIPPGSMVQLERGPEPRDRYGRLLLYLRRQSDGLFVNQWMIEGGFADSVNYAPNDGFAEQFDRARDQARSQKRGLWAACDGPDQPLQ